MTPRAWVMIVALGGIIAGWFGLPYGLGFLSAFYLLWRIGGGE